MRGGGGYRERRISRTMCTGPTVKRRTGTPDLLVTAGGEEDVHFHDDHVVDGVPVPLQYFGAGELCRPSAKVGRPGATLGPTAPPQMEPPPPSKHSPRGGMRREGAA